MTDAAPCYLSEPRPSTPRLRPSRIREAPAIRTILPRPFQHVDELSYGEPGAGNLLIQGENLRVLQALPETYVGAVRCIYIDPPYNNQEQYRHYGDVSTHDRVANHDGRPDAGDEAASRARRLDLDLDRR